MLAFVDAHLLVESVGERLLLVHRGVVGAYAERLEVLDVGGGGDAGVLSGEPLDGRVDTVGIGDRGGIVGLEGTGRLDHLLARGAGTVGHVGLGRGRTGADRGVDALRPGDGRRRRRAGGD